MTKEKQIRDIENIIFAFTPLDTMRYEVENAASALYHAGYRKQSEGEWLDTGDEELDKIYSGYKCSVCGFIICGHSGKYCCECGAKMKGGTE